ncbi:MAG: winged helix-turn-helix transcriptional regulator [Parvularcula sp.]
MVGWRLLLVDEEQDLALALAALFAQHGEFSLEHETAPSMISARLSDGLPPDAVLVSAKPGAADASGQMIRDGGYEGPLLILCAENETTLPGTETITRPFRFGVLVTRLRQLIREFETSDEAVVSIGPFRFYPADKSLVLDSGEVTRLTDKEAAILRSLHRAGNRPIARQTLLEEVWGYNSGVTTHTLETHIYRLRQKLEQGDTPALLVTDAGGYRLVTN